MSEHHDLAVINANIGLTNCIEEKDINTIIIDTFKEIANILSDHCGPYGKFAMIPNTHNLIAEPTFTKDGINIVRALEYASPMQTYVKQILAYMGSRIERAAGDGTTSAMIICATALQNLITGLIDIQKNKHIAYTYDELEKQYNLFIETIERLYECDTHNVFSIKKLLSRFISQDAAISEEELVFRVAYSQAYTSSHGDKELANAIATLYSSTPEMAWNCICIDKSNYESSKRYYIELDNYQYTMDNVRIFPTTAMTADLGNKCIQEDIPTIITGQIPGIGNIDTDDLRNIISTAIITGEKLAIICPDEMDGGTQSWLKNLFNENKHHKVIFFFVPVRNIQFNDIVCAKVLSNNFDKLATVNLDLMFDGKYLKINKLYKNPNKYLDIDKLHQSRIDDMIHPYYKNKEYADYNKLVDHIDALIAQIKSEVANSNNNYQLMELQKLRLKLTVTQRAHFLIGGSAYDAAALTDVAIDCMLAVKNTLTRGFTYGGNISLANILTSKTTVHNKKYLPLHKLFSNSFIDAIMAVHKANYKYSNTKMPIALPKHSIDITNTKQQITIDDLNKLTRTEYMKRPIIIQPMLVDLELIRRFGEIALKFTKMQRIIVPGGIYTTQEKS